jgi:hypothetical protein
MLNLILRTLLETPFRLIYKKRVLCILSPEEKNVLLGYLISDTKTRYFSLNDGIIGGLELKSIIYRSARTTQDDKQSFNMHDWVWEYFHKHPKFVAVSKSHAQAIKMVFRSLENKRGKL